MKTFVFLSLMLWGVCSSMKAQEVMTAQDEIAAKKEINQIKLSGESFYTEVPPMTNNSDEALSTARKKALDKLCSNVVSELTKNKKMTTDEIKEVKSRIESASCDITIRKEDYLRVFMYVPKSEFGITVVKRTPRRKTDAMPNDSTISLPKDTLVVKEDTVVVITEEEKEKEVEAVLPVEEEVVPTICETIIAKKTYGQLMNFLKAGKAEQKLMYGSHNTMLSLDKCYVAIVDKTSRSIVAVLSKGGDERMNYITKQNDRYTNYAGGKYAVIFIQEY